MLPKLFFSQTHLLDDLLEQPARQIARMNWDYSSEIVVFVQHDCVAAGLVIHDKTRAFQGADDLFGTEIREPGQARAGTLTEMPSATVDSE